MTTERRRLTRTAVVVGILALAAAGVAGLALRDESPAPPGATAPEQVSLSVSGAGGSGRVTSDPGGIDCSSPGICSGSVVKGTDVTFTAIPAGISSFVRWDGVTCAGEDANEAADPPTCTVTASDDVEVTAVFHEVG